MAAETVNSYFLLPFHPNQRSGFNWARTWQTGIGSSVQGDEDRQAMRPTPGHRYEVALLEFDTVGPNKMHDQIRAALSDGRAAFPAWGFGTELQTSAFGTSANLLDPVYKFAIGDYVLLQNEAGEYDVVLLTSAGLLTIGWSGSISRTYAKGLHVWPILFGTLKRAPSKAVTNEHAGANLIFETDSSRLRAAPRLPESLAVNHVSGENVITWGMGGGDIAAVEIQRNTASAGWVDLVTLTEGELTYTDDPAPGAENCYRIRATGCAGESDWTGSQCYTEGAGPGGEDDLPQQGNALLWLDAGDLVLSNSDPVSTWLDDSPAGNNATEATNQPTYLTSQVNSLPAVHFTAQEEMQLPNGFANLTAGVTIIAVYSMASANTGRNILFLDETGINPNKVRLRGDTGAATGVYEAQAIGGDIVETNQLDDVNAGAYKLCTLVHGASSFSWYVDSVLEDSGSAYSAPPNATRRTNTIGEAIATSGTFNDLYLAELVVFATALNDTDRGLWETFLASKYGL